MHESRDWRISAEALEHRQIRSLYLGGRYEPHIVRLSIVCECHSMLMSSFGCDPSEEHICRNTVIASNNY